MRNVKLRQQIGPRLLEERNRLGLTQQGLAEAVGCARLSIINYESGCSSPAAETLAAMESVGIDVRFVLTGMRDTPSGIDRERFRVAFEEIQRQAKVKREKLSTNSSLDLAWRLYDALGAIERTQWRA
ncbi:helix-turn-helix domain-containing protein [Duganella sp. BJB475]|uniref:helix-turn-helix domain-containing protein n=1 Tax=Duganella sp. BJB475 TaxID=2233914 RepID=UPI000E357862|nr:helix-turn-helix transcriptional regulator [Duganella sp. BJB475]RFP15083.1 XRE family transcriptional regulator [Duganella sp. BJB475]